jgi:hypothetical protein
VKPPASSAHSKKRENLKAMADRGTEHEARIAREKLAKLEASVDFESKAEEQHADLFSGLPGFSTAEGSQSRVLSVEEKDSEIGSYVKWAFLDRLKLSSIWKKQPSGRNELMVSVAKTDIPPLKELADHIQKSFSIALREFTAGGAINSGKRAPFLSGLYDGMMGVGRDSGIRVPAAIGSGKSRKKSRKAAVAPVLEIHPYELGLAVGAKIALKIPPKALKGEMRKLMSA